MPSGLRNVFPGLIPLISTTVPGMHNYIPHVNANQILHFVSETLTFLIQKPIVRLLPANWRMVSQYLKYKFSLYVGILASCSPVYELYVVEQILPFNKELPSNTRSSKPALVLNSFLNNLFNTAHVQHSLQQTDQLQHCSVGVFLLHLQWRKNGNIAVVLYQLSLVLYLFYVSCTRIPRH